MLDIGYGKGTAMMVAAVGAGMDAVGVEINSGVHSNLHDFLSHNWRVDLDEAAEGPQKKRPRYALRSMKTRHARLCA